MKCGIVGKGIVIMQKIKKIEKALLVNSNWHQLYSLIGFKNMPVFLQDCRQKFNVAEQDLDSMINQIGFYCIESHINVKDGRIVEYE